MSKRMIKSPWHRCIAAVVVLLFLVTLCVRAQDPPTTRTQPVSAKVESKTGAISGRVVTEELVQVRHARQSG